MSNILKLSITLLLITISVSTACNVDDLNALIAFKNSFPTTTFPSSWTNASTDCCTWDFIYCDSVTNRVDTLQLYGPSNAGPTVDLSGSIPESIGDLPFLRTLKFANVPKLVGTIPPQIANLKNLESLTISGTAVSGPIPLVLSQLSSLQLLDLSNNKLFGTIPPSVCGLVNLTTLNLSGNQLTGSIPSTIHSALLYLSNNNLTGTIPPSFANVSTFSIVHLENNQLTGDPSPFFGSTKTLSNIVLFNNKFSFDLSNVEYPEETLEYLDMSHNEIYGSISDQILQCASILYFDVSYNQLCGEIPGGGKFVDPEYQGAKYFANNKCLCGAPLKTCK